MLLLFDIDGTLLVGATAAHREALAFAVTEVHGVPVPEAFVATAGRTDPAICRSILQGAGVPDEEIERGAADVAAAACAAYANLCPTDLTEFVAPAAHDALQELGATGHLMSLVTGNLEPIARLKLGRAGVGACFPVGQGGFGSDAEQRGALPAIARARAGDVARDDAVIIGDTPLDIACAREDGIRCIAITTGPHPAAELQDADACIDSLAELPALLRAF